jgi:hypothetical protein
MQNIFGMNWKTTLIGWIMAFMNTFIPFYQSSGKINIRDIIVSICMVIMGHAAKDYDVTGGNRSNNIIRLPGEK